MSKYYKLKASMTFSTILLIPVDNAKDIDEAIQQVDYAIESNRMSLPSEGCEYDTKFLEFTELDENDAKLFYPILITKEAED